MIGWACRQLAIWGGLCLLLYAAVSHRELLLPQDDGKAAAAPATAAVPQPQQPTFNALTYHADKRGHVWLEAAVNGAPIRFLVDTGASFVALNLADAAAAGISRGSRKRAGARCGSASWRSPMSRALSTKTSGSRCSA